MTEKQREAKKEATDHYSEMNKQRCAATFEEVEPDADLDEMDQCGNDGDENDEAMRQTPPQVRHDVGSTKRRCVEPVFFPTFDSLAKGMSGCPRGDLTRLRGAHNRAVEKKLNQEQADLMNSMSRNPHVLSCSVPRGPKSNSSSGGWSLVCQKDRKAKNPERKTFLVSNSDFTPAAEAPTRRSCFPGPLDGASSPLFAGQPAVLLLSTTSFSPSISVPPCAVLVESPTAALPRWFRPPPCACKGCADRGVSPARAAGTCARSAGTLHDLQQVSQFSLAKRSRSGAGAGQGVVQVPGGCGTWEGLHLGTTRSRRNLLVARECAAPRTREFGCSKVTPGLVTFLRTWTMLGSSGNAGLVMRRLLPHQGTIVCAHTHMDMQFNHKPVPPFSQRRLTCEAGSHPF